MQTDDLISINNRKCKKDNLLVRQAYSKVMEQQMEELRLRTMLERVQRSKIVLTFSKQLTPFCFPIKVDSIRENMTSEKLEDRIRKMQAQLERGVVFSSKYLVLRQEIGRF